MEKSWKIIFLKEWSPCLLHNGQNTNGYSKTKIVWLRSVCGVEFISVPVSN